MKSMFKKIRKFWNTASRKISALTIAYGGKAVIKVILATCKVQIEGIEKFSSLAAKERCILMLWHNRLTLVAHVLHKYAPQFTYVAFISNSRDGEMLAAVANSYKQGKTIRVAHHSKHNALREMIKQLKADKEVMLMTPDGPRGPKYHTKPGIALAAKSAKAKIIPFSWSASHFWQLKTWDRLIIPKPFAKIVISLGDPVHLANTVNTVKDSNSLSEETLELQDTLNALSERTCEQITSDRSLWPK